MDKQFNFSVWLFSSLVAGFLVGGGMALAEGSNLWPFGAILGGIIGLIIGAIFGAILKLIKVPMKYAWCVFGFLLFLVFCIRIYINFFYTSDFGKLVEATVVRCESSPHFFTPPDSNGKERRELNGVDLTLKVSKERKLGKFEDWRIKVYEWKSVDYTNTYFMEETNCGTMNAGKVIFLRTQNYGLDYEYVHRIHWNESTISRDGRFIIDR